MSQRESGSLGQGEILNSLNINIGSSSNSAKTRNPRGSLKTHMTLKLGITKDCVWRQAEEICLTEDEPVEIQEVIAECVG